MKRVLPAYPLFIKDPNFSLWSASDELNGKNPQTWWDEEKRMYGFLHTDGEVYCFLGNANDLNVKKAVQTDVSVSTFSTDYSFACGKTTLKVKFVSPLPLDDFNILSMPVCYVEYEIENGKDSEISLFASRDLAYNLQKGGSDGIVRGGVLRCGGFAAAVIGLARQMPLSNAEDRLGADWGYWYLAGKNAFYTDIDGLKDYLENGRELKNSEKEDKFVCVTDKGKSGVIALGYDEGISIDYFGEYKKGYYLENNTILDALLYVCNGYRALDDKLNKFNDEIIEASKEYGNEYLTVLYAAYRQSVGAHKLVKDKNGKVLFLSKENSSNGCIATVDVSYPSMPLYLLYAPELVKGMLRPIFKFAKSKVWKFDFAPHDVGSYPFCVGQQYGLAWENEYGLMREDMIGSLFGVGNAKTPVTTRFPIYLLSDEKNLYNIKYQMPVEECANVIVMTLAVYRKDGDISFFKENEELLSAWVKYLVRYGLKPENQLCTDDFAGHLANNLNLAIKATVGIAAYAELLDACGKNGEEYRETAKRFASEIETTSDGKTHSPLTWDGEDDTFGLKYNLAFDKIFGFGLFDDAFTEKEVDYYISKTDNYGVPLDNRRKWCKSDWIIWAARITDDIEKRKKMIAPVYNFLAESESRLPFSDWYESDTGKVLHFRARSVQGACFILLL